MNTFCKQLKDTKEKSHCDNVECVFFAICGSKLKDTDDKLRAPSIKVLDAKTMISDLKYADIYAEVRVMDLSMRSIIDDRWLEAFESQYNTLNLTEHNLVYTFGTTLLNFLYATQYWMDWEYFNERQVLMQKRVQHMEFAWMQHTLDRILPIPRKDFWAYNQQIRDMRVCKIHNWDEIQQHIDYLIENCDLELCAEDYELCKMRILQQKASVDVNIMLYEVLRERELNKTTNYGMMLTFNGFLL